MKKQEFLSRQKRKLSDLPSREVEERLVFYSEMIDDRMEEGKTEAQAVLEIGSADMIAAQIRSELAAAPEVAMPQMQRRRKWRAWQIVLLILGFPLWFPLCITVAAVVFSVYITLWAVAVVTAWSVFVSVAASALGCAALGGVLIADRLLGSGLAALGAALVCAGLAILLFFVCKAATKATVTLTKYLFAAIRRLFF